MLHPDINKKNKNKIFLNLFMKFYIIPSPIGNLDDVTFRSINILKELDFLVVENLQITDILLKKYKINIKKNLTYNDKSTERVRVQILNNLKNGRIGGIISDAGTPLISDPGYKLIKKLKANNIQIVPLPGPSAVISSLVGSGLPTSKFQFVGFFPRGEKKSKQFVLDILEYNGTTIFFESPKRIKRTLEVFFKPYQKSLTFCIAKEISKIHESFFLGSYYDVMESLSKSKSILKGEFVVLVYAVQETQLYHNSDELYSILIKKLQFKTTIEIISKLTNIGKNELYKRYLAFDD